MIKLSNLFLALKYQLPLKRALRNFIITRNAWGMFSRYSHISRSTGKPKIAFPTYESASSAAEQMGKKHGKHFSVYKCLFCDGFHIGKNRDNKYETPEK